MASRRAWIIWCSFALAGSGYLGSTLLGQDKTVYVPGTTSDGHYQIELRCDTCHAYAFGGGPVLQKRCLTCHGEELQRIQDSHPRRVFIDPRNADRIADVDASQCISCHKEHRPEMDRGMGVTLPVDFCFYCHEDIAEDRLSHRDVPFDTCADAGCHNFHDNSGLYEAFLVKNAEAPDTLDIAKVPKRNAAEVRRMVNKRPLRRLTRDDHDAPRYLDVEEQIILDWEETAHAKSEVNCMDCHQVAGITNEWRDNPEFKACNTCHKMEVSGYIQGKHGMRLALELSPMTPAQARLPMKKKNRDNAMGCTSCHRSHRFDTVDAAVKACLKCHDDQHSKAYKASLHFDLWRKENEGEGETGRGVSCATCHLPREVRRHRGKDIVRVQHNQNGNLRPNETMIRDVCLRCHGLSFSLDALADESLIRNNFKGGPARHVKSIDWAVARAKNAQRDKERQRVK